jgi:ferrous-iron efflux pump FieF
MVIMASMHSHSHSHIPEHTANSQMARMMKRATYFAVFAASVLIGLKFYAWAATDSVSLLSSLVDSSLDMFISLLNLFAVRYALMPADEDHRYGHHGAEDVAALAQAAFVAGSALFISISAIGKLISPEPVQESGIGIAVMVFSIGVTLALVLYQRKVARLTGSTAIHADSLHYAGDLLMNVAVIAALLISTYFDFHYADPLFALLIAFYIVHGAWEIGVLAFDKLMDKEFDEDEREKLIKVISDHEGSLGVHDLKTRRSGTKPFIQFHLELDGEQSLNEAHIIADKLELRLEGLYPGAEVVVHQDPHGFTREGSD